MGVFDGVTPGVFVGVKLRVGVIEFVGVIVIVGTDV